MIQEHVLNLTESEKLYTPYKRDIKIKQCYDNIFKMVSVNISKFTSGEWKVAFGYTEGLPGAPLLIRHCFIVNSEGEAIDPTMFAASNLPKERKYFSYHIFQSYNDYVEFIIKEMCASPDRFMRNIEKKKSQQWATDNNYIIIG